MMMYPIEVGQPIPVLFEGMEGPEMAKIVEVHPSYRPGVGPMW